MVQEIIGTIAGRWYVTLFGIAFVVLASRHLGWRRTGIYAAGALAIGIVAENGSVRWGIPYTRYSFNGDLRGRELFVGDVPLMVSLSYTFMSYFAFASARLIVGGPYRTRSPMPVLEYLTAVMLGVWAIWVVDPVSRLGAHFFLGELFTYDGPGFWFGLPLGSQLGFTVTVGLLVGLLTWLLRDEPTEPVGRLLDHPRLGALGGFLGQVIFMAATAFIVARTSSDPLVVKTADALAGSAFIIFLPAALLVAVHWRSLVLARRRVEAEVSGTANT
ncbi:MAG: carotenoid biosynthesis protein [Actinobacteria bacterium]|nr:carotenoid biosynthesis protein [Actinomycetota bacterium]